MADCVPMLFRRFQCPAGEHELHNRSYHKSSFATRNPSLVNMLHIWNSFLIEAFRPNAVYRRPRQLNTLPNKTTFLMKFTRCRNRKRCYCAQLSSNAPRGRGRQFTRQRLSPICSGHDRCEFVHSQMADVTVGGVLDGGFHGETFIPQRFARETPGCFLRLVEFQGGSGHLILLFAKPHRA